MFPAGKPVGLKQLEGDKELNGCRTTTALQQLYMNASCTLWWMRQQLQQTLPLLAAEEERLRTSGDHSEARMKAWVVEAVVCTYNWLTAATMWYVFFFGRRLLPLDDERLVKYFVDALPFS